MDKIKVFLFDVFGTLVEWRKTIAKSLQVEFGSQENIDWTVVAVEWHSYYKKNSQLLSKENMPFKSTMEILQESLPIVLQKYGIVASDRQLDRLSMVWHHLPPHDDVVEGLHLLKKNALVCPLSNGNLCLQIDLARHGNLPWDYIFSPDTITPPHVCKPNPRVYKNACQVLNISDTSHACLVAAHLTDLQAAKECGLSTCYLQRENEETDDVAKFKHLIDYYADSLVDFASYIS